MSGGVGSAAAMVSVMANGGAGRVLLSFPSKQLQLGCVSSDNGNENYFFPRRLKLSMQIPTRRFPTLKKAVAATDSNQVDTTDPANEVNSPLHFMIKP